MQFKNPVEPKIGYIYEGYDNLCYRVESFTVTENFERIVNLSLLTNPSRMISVNDKIFRSEIDFERYPSLKGEKLYNYMYIGK